MTLRIPATDRAAAGAAALDVVRPAWFNEIDLDVLDIRDADACICGQLLMWLEPPFDTPEASATHGVVSDFKIDWREDYVDLTAAWTVEILKRRTHELVTADADK